MDKRLQIPLEDFLHCESYYTFCDYHFLDNNNQDLVSGIIHSDPQAIPNLFKRIKDFPDRTYTVISARSDYGPAYQKDFQPYADMVRWISLMMGPDLGYNGITAEARVKHKNCKETDKYSIRCWSMTSHTFDEIPPNIIKWYTTNCHIANDNRVAGIPFGLNVTDGNKSGIKAIWEHKTEKERNKLLYVNFSFNTFDRAKLYSFYKLYDFATCKKDIANPEYLDDLATHRFILCPAGNGVDCYRIWEALYMGAVPIVEINEVTHHLLTLGLPIIGVHTLLALNVLELEYIWKKVQENWNKYHWDKLKASYWRNLIRGQNENSVCNIAR